jgi:hypothetical protein
VEFVRPEFGRWIAEAVTGVTIFGKAEAADSVPGPAFEKKTENGVWLAIGNVVAEFDSAAGVEVETGALWCPAATRTGALPCAVVDWAAGTGAATGSGALLASICAARFKTVALGVCAFGVDTSATGAGLLAEIGPLKVTLPRPSSLEALASPALPVSAEGGRSCCGTGSGKAFANKFEEGGVTFAV